MIGKLSPEAVSQIVIVVATVVANALISNFIWWLLGSIRPKVKVLARISAAGLALLNLGLGTVCVLTMLREGPTWFYIALLSIAIVFAFRVGGATRGQYN